MVVLRCFTSSDESAHVEQRLAMAYQIHLPGYCVEVHHERHDLRSKEAVDAVQSQLLAGVVHLDKAALVLS